ncbi:DNA ligase [Paenibacillus sp. S-38]|uniref:ATP-dependent DNA ligase n=1 Tax=Paenibacillus sp. S-38 TaxID=3416710 RepID=UPI003CF30A05
MLNQPLKPMLLQPSHTLKPDWPASLKWDGFRAIIHYNEGRTRAFTREGNEITASFFPELSQLKLNCRSAILDGECICFDLLNQTPGQPPKAWWDDAMARFHTKKEAAVKKAAQTMRAHFPVWDILFLDGVPLLKKTFLERREHLKNIVGPGDIVSVTPLYEDGEQLFARAKELGLEGVVQYRPDSSYSLDARPKNVWEKVKAYQYATVQVSSMKRSEFGWGLSIGGKYVGVLEFPPPAAERKAFIKIAKQITRGENKDWIFVDPVISCTVKFQCFTKDGKLRSPKFEAFCT